MKALIVGATGATGKALLELLLSDEYFEQVEVFVRRPIELNHPKLITHIVDFTQPDTWEGLIKGNILFSALGTTLKDAGSSDAMWSVDYDLQLAFAQAASQNRISHYILISAQMANPKSKIFYNRMKGLLEQEILKLAFQKITIFRPPLLIRPNSNRTGEVLLAKILNFSNYFGVFKKFRPLHIIDLAKAMVFQAKHSNNNIEILEANEIFQILEKRN